VKLTAAVPVAVLASLLLLAPLRAQQFHSRTDLVSVYTTVTDRAGHLITDLKQDDFEVRDNGKVQKITLFSADPQPISIVVMLDRSGSMEENFTLVQDAAVQFVQKLLPDDRARIGDFARQIIMRPDTFTNNRAELVGYLQHDLQQFGPSPIWTAIDRSITALLDQPNRRVVLIFSDGHDNPMRGQVFTELGDVIRRATYDEVMTYAIGLASENTGGSWVVGRGPMGRIQMGPSHGIDKPDPGLHRLAEETGGGYFELTFHDDLAATFARVAEELHRQYWLAFPPGKLDGETHKLEVKVKRADLTARARKSYVAAQK
jgi:Ca-activated chloride channel family protein